MTTCAWDRPACWQPASLGSELCGYHLKLTAGLLRDSFGRAHDDLEEDEDDD